MARIGILTCSNCTQDLNCASVVCLGALRKRKGLFASYNEEDQIALIGIISCAGCPTLAAPDKILKRVKALAEYHLDALHVPYCMTTLYSFIKKYENIVRDTYSDVTLVHRTYTPKDKNEFRAEVKEPLDPTVCIPQDINAVIKRTIRTKKKKKKKE